EMKKNYNEGIRSNNNIISYMIRMISKEIDNTFDTVQYKDMKTFKEKDSEIFNPYAIDTISPVILPPKQNYSKKTYYFIINSKDRNLELYPKPSLFQVKLNPTSNQPKTKQLIINNIKYCFNEEIFGEWNASIPLTYENIYSLKCVSVYLPFETIYSGGIS